MSSPFERTFAAAENSGWRIGKIVFWTGLTYAAWRLLIKDADLEGG